MRSTSADDVSIHAVSPLSIFEGAGAPAAGAGAAVPAGGVGCWAVATAAASVAATRRSIARTRLNRFTESPYVCRRGASAPDGRRIITAPPGPRPTVGVSQRRLVPLARTDANGDFHRSHEDVAGLRGRRHHVGDLFHEVIRHDDLHLDLREEVDGVLTAAIELRMALLPSEPANLRYGHADHADAGERLLHVIE